jgi:predicted N-acetyltransferase YhbS
VTQPGTLTVRPLSGDDETRPYFRLAEYAFDTEPTESAAREWGDFVLGLEEFRPDMLRGAFRDDTLLGGCIVYPRQMRIGSALVPTGCIGAVVTDPTLRLGGVASTFLRDADAYARERGDALLLLDGIPHFYHRFGYVKVVDMSVVVLAAAALVDLPETTVTVRLTTMADAEALQVLYTTANQAATGSFARTPRQQGEKLINRIENPPYVAVRPDGTLCGYLSIKQAAPRNISNEVIALDEATIIALLRFHRDMNPGLSLRWALAPTSPITYWLQDHLTIPGYERTADPRFIGAVTTEIVHQDNTAWMAKVADLGTLARVLLPEWQRRRLAANLATEGLMLITVGDLGTIALGLGEDHVRLLHATSGGDIEVRVTEAQFTQMVFGYRPVSWIATQAGSEGVAAALAPLRVLFPHDWPLIPSSDGF